MTPQPYRRASCQERRRLLAQPLRPLDETAREQESLDPRNLTPEQRDTLYTKTAYLLRACVEAMGPNDRAGVSVRALALLLESRLQMGRTTI